MSWKPELEEIARRHKRAAEMGGEERVARRAAQIVGSEIRGPKARGMRP